MYTRRQARSHGERRERESPSDAFFNRIVHVLEKEGKRKSLGMSVRECVSASHMYTHIHTHNQVASLSLSLFLALAHIKASC